MLRSLQTFSGANNYFHRYSNGQDHGHLNGPAIPFDKLPFDNDSGLYFNYIFDFRSGEMIYLSKRFIELTGYDASFFKSGFESWQQIICPQDRMAVLRSVSVHTEALLKIGNEQINQYSDNSTFRIITREEHLLKLLRQRLFIAQDAAGNFVYEAGMFLDITPIQRDGNLRLVINDPNGHRYLEYYPKEDDLPGVFPIRKILQELHHCVIKADDPFLSAIFKVLSENYGDADLDVKTMGGLLHISRSQLYRQLEKFLSISPNRLIRIYRLHRSLEYLVQDDLNISEVAWRVGFNDHSWFSRCFFEEFGCTPSDYRHLMQ
ncbi:MAG TPA: helix-turn-helix domain-containing protein [Phnomibacter sp.]|nr:helix-turn-helix domain-containing protein [Phnomibacter sp.]